MPFYKKDYYHADLCRVCDFEELIIDWYPLNITDDISRERVLLMNGFDDLLDHSNDFHFIANSFMYEGANLQLTKVFVGGIDFRVLKLELKAQNPKACLIGCTNPRSSVA